MSFEMLKNFKHLPLEGASLNRKWTFSADLRQESSLVRPDCIFPIMTQENGDMKLIGTGFYITENGLFVTAKHVLFSVLDMIGTQTKPIFIMHFTAANNYIIRPILRAWCHEVADISVGAAAPMQHAVNGPLKNGLIPISFKPVKDNTDIASYAYPNFHTYKSGTIQTLYFRPDFYEGKIIQHHKIKRDNSLMKWECYETNMHIHGGASGGPVVNSQGEIFAINTSSMELYTNVSYITPVSLIKGAVVKEAKFDNEETVRDISISELISKKVITIA